MNSNLEEFAKKMSEILKVEMHDYNIHSPTYNSVSFGPVKGCPFIYVNYYGVYIELAEFCSIMDGEVVLDEFIKNSIWFVKFEPINYLGEIRIPDEGLKHFKLPDDAEELKECINNYSKEKDLFELSNNPMVEFCSALRNKFTNYKFLSILPLHTSKELVEFECIFPTRDVGIYDVYVADKIFIEVFRTGTFDLDSIEYKIVFPGVTFYEP